MRLLVVEDDQKLLGILADGLSDHGIGVVGATSFADGGSRAALGSYDVIVLDVMLPGGSGFDLCHQLRARGDTTPILMLTARTGVEDRVRGLEAGADDYLGKPFSFAELLARVRALARRSVEIKIGEHGVADLVVNLDSHQVHRAGRAIHLTPREWDLLEFFVRHEGSVVDRGAIATYVWDDNHDPLTNAVEVLVRRLRRKVDDAFEPKLIATVRGAGYRFGA